MCLTEPSLLGLVLTKRVLGLGQTGHRHRLRHLMHSICVFCCSHVSFSRSDFTRIKHLSLCIFRSFSLSTNKIQIGDGLSCFSQYECAHVVAIKQTYRHTQTRSPHTSTQYNSIVKTSLRCLDHLPRVQLMLWACLTWAHVSHTSWVCTPLPCVPHPLVYKLTLTLTFPISPSVCCLSKLISTSILCVLFHLQVCRVYIRGQTTDMRVRCKVVVVVLAGVETSKQSTLPWASRGHLA